MGAHQARVLCSQVRSQSAPCPSRKHWWWPVGKRGVVNPRSSRCSTILAALPSPALYTCLSTRNGSDKQAVITFDARKFRSDGRGELDLDDIKLLDRDKVDAACPRLGEVQERTDLAAEVVSRTHGYLSPTEFGTAVHTNLKRR